VTVAQPCNDSGSRTSVHDCTDVNGRTQQRVDAAIAQVKANHPGAKLAEMIHYGVTKAVQMRSHEESPNHSQAQGSP
jgi:hypothetical protein